MSKIIRSAVCLCVSALLLTCTGCGTFLARSGVMALSFKDPKEILPPVYPATALDAGFIASPFCPNETESVGKRVVQGFGGVVDLPISMATDTLCLPYDIYQAASK